MITPSIESTLWSVQQDRIINSGYGQNVVSSYLTVCEALFSKIDARFIKEFTDAVSFICIKSGKANAVLFCNMAANLGFKNHSTNEFGEWQDKIIEVTKRSPKVCKAILENNNKTTHTLDLKNWLEWVTTGLRYGAKNDDALVSYFSLANKVSISFFYEQSGTVIFGSIKDQLQYEIRSLFNISPKLKPLSIDHISNAGQRPSFTGKIFFLPSVCIGSRKRAIETYQASAFHMAAHKIYGMKPFEIGQLKPMQIAIISLIEDARIEMLAARNLPGINRLWKTYHDTPSSGSKTAPRMFARLARALIDPDYETDDSWVIKGKKMFFQAKDSWHEPRISRVIGNILGNDLGQLRVQFNAKDYVTQPAYRDDNSGIWNLPEDIHDKTHTLELEVDLVEKAQNLKSNAPTQNDKKKNDENQNNDTGKASLSELKEDSGRLLQKLPEFDYAARKIRQDWVSVYEYGNTLGPPNYMKNIEEEYSSLIQKSETFFRALSVGTEKRLKKQFQGENLDLDAAIDASISVRTNNHPEQNFYQDRSKPMRSLAIHLLLDTSESTRTKVPNSRKSIIDLEKDSAAILAKALDKINDPFAITGFCSNGRHDVKVQSIKKFTENFGIMNAMSLAGLSSGYSTRLGAALRHCSFSFDKIHAHRKLILLVTDGYPSDIDVDDVNYLAMDTKQAVVYLKELQIDVFCVALGKNSAERAEKIFGKSRCIVINNLTTLPSKLATLYVKLTS